MRGGGAHLEVGTVPQQVSQSSNTDYGYIKQRGIRHRRAHMEHREVLPRVRSGWGRGGVRVPPPRLCSGLD